jgi:hypothetical protein
VLLLWPLVGVARRRARVLPPEPEATPP